MSTMPASFETGEPAKWPKVVGIVSIVWSVLGVTCGGCGLASGAMTEWAASMAPPEFGPMPAELKPMGLQLGLAGAGMFWALLLMASGIACVMRKPGARPLHLTYAIGAIVLGLAGAYLGYMQQQVAMQFVRDNPSSKWAQQAKPEIGLIMLVVGTALALAWPVFCLIWFGMVKRRGEGLDGGADLPA
jgi:hypothetical protein